ncbi:FAD-binding oxidoreductase [Pseudonocardia sp. HH130630-07]|uniref:FAD-binding oxidoreductase n=1 Tax=Pseudonocardia sp. HH130630-07 TaxID=1690815 RepID=UPI000814E786|nr:FAD-binding protein [Pseudonocardia sp. HH130630-07]ANY08975.1 FAD-binding oxidoreductase [Pseudonocardia sp. HH130630-07]
MTPVQDVAQRLAAQWGDDRVLRPGDDGFATATRLWNGAVRTRPAVVVRPRSTAEVSAAVVAATQAGVGLSVRGGGHDWAGRALNDGGLVLDLGELRAVQVAGDVATAGGGSRSADVVAAAAAGGYVVATGTAGVVGMAGLSMGGGYGPLLGTAGLAADNLLGAEVVLADGTVVSTDDDPELLWALRGGGGNFGVVTGLRVRLHEDRGLVGGMVLFPWSEAASVLTRYAELVADAPDGLTLLIEMTVVPDVGPCLLAVPVWSGPASGADAALARVERLGTPLTSGVASATQAQLLAGFDAAVPDGMHWQIRTRSVAALTPAVIDAVLASAAARPGPGAGIGLRQFHGAATRVGADDTAFGTRTAHVALEISAGHGPDDDPAPYRAWAEATDAAVAPHALPGGYPNFLGPDRHEQIGRAYGAHASRLVAVKERYDPGHVFTATPIPTREQLRSS